VIVDYGPPARSGVTSLQYVSGFSDEARNVMRFAKAAGWLATGVWAFAALTKRPLLRRFALGAASLSFLLDVAYRRRAESIAAE
jgi:hypothetical protein